MRDTPGIWRAALVALPSASPVSSDAWPVGKFVVVASDAFLVSCNTLPRSDAIRARTVAGGGGLLPHEASRAKETRNGVRMTARTLQCKCQPRLRRALPAV